MCSSDGVCDPTAMKFCVSKSALEAVILTNFIYKLNKGEG